MGLTRSQRQHVADYLKDSGNVILAALVIAGAIDKNVGWLVIAAGIVLFFGLLIYTTWLRGRG
jgi:hypothetical protein